MFPRFFGSHFAVVDGLEFNIGGIGDAVPDHVAFAVVLEPAAIGVMAPQIGVDGVGSSQEYHTDQALRRWR